MLHPTIERRGPPPPSSEGKLHLHHSSALFTATDAPPSQGRPPPTHRNSRRRHCLESTIAIRISVAVAIVPLLNKEQWPPSSSVGVSLLTLSPDTFGGSAIEGRPGTHRRRGTLTYLRDPEHLPAFSDVARAIARGEVPLQRRGGEVGEGVWRRGGRARSKGAGEGGIRRVRVRGGRHMPDGDRRKGDV